MERAALADLALHRTARADPASGDTSTMEPQVEDQKRVQEKQLSTDQERMTRRQGLWTRWRIHLSADAISTGVDSGVMPPAMLEQMVWDASVMPVSTEMDAAVMPIAMVAVTTKQSRWSSSTGAGTDMHASTRALEDDEAASSRSGSGVAQPFSDEDRSDIVRIGPQAKYREPGDTRQRRDQTSVLWGQGIPIRPAVTTQRPTGSVLSRAAAVPTTQQEGGATRLSAESAGVALR